MDRYADGPLGRDEGRRDEVVWRWVTRLGSVMKE